MQHLLKKNFKTTGNLLKTTKKYTMNLNHFAIAQGYKPKIKKRVMDGNNTASYVAYGFSENSFIYPISPSSSMGDHMDKYMSENIENMFGQVVDCVQMQSEGGAAGALHGAIASGALTSTFTASQGLLLMIPNMYLMAGELAPTVIHVASRTVAKHALSIFNDHSDVMAARQTGFAMLCSANVQEVHDMSNFLILTNKGVISHVSTLKTSIPFLHFFDGWQTSHSLQNVELLEYQDMKLLFPYDDAKKNLREKSMTSINPLSRGTGQRPDIFFQQNVAGKKYYDVAPEKIQETMDQFAKLTGRKHSLFSWHGDPNAELGLVLMGSGAQSSKEVVDYFNQQGKKYGILKVSLYRPWSEKHFLEALPKSIKKICVLDKTREEGGVGNPLYLDTLATLNRARPDIKIISGTYGLASKNFTPGQISSIFSNLERENPHHHFTVGIEDDVTHTSLEVKDIEHTTVQKGTIQCINWGFGGDGSVGAMNSTTKIIAEQTSSYVSLFHSYDSKKEGGATVSHLRFGPTQITSEYLIDSEADFITCTKEPFVRKYDLIRSLKENGTFLLNTPDTDAERIEKNLPPKLLRDIANKKAKFYVIDAGQVAKDAGMAKRTNTVMQVSFFALALEGKLSQEDSLKLLKNDITKRFKIKGDKIVNKNLEMIDKASQSLRQIKVPEHWKTIPDKQEKDQNYPEFIKNIMNPVLALEGDKLPVSSFEAGGLFPQHTTQYEKRGVANEVPTWLKDNCTQCNICAMVCPHAVIRPFLLTRDEKKQSPKGYETIKAKGGPEMAGYEYSIQVSPFDCTGCAVCVQSCPDDALIMVDFRDESQKTKQLWDYSVTLPVRDNVTNPFTVKGSQFLRPYFEFSGACAGCGETPYMKLASQLFGKRMIIANASGCSSVWGGTAATSPWVVDEKNRGTAWARSLFEDNAEYGFGMLKAYELRKKKLILDSQKAIAEVPELSADIKACLQKWLDNNNNVEVCDEVFEQMEVYLDQLKKQGLLDKYLVLKEIDSNKKIFVKESHWIVGGDGWAYDIGFGGLDHILSKNQNINVLIFDTEMYSNTGGQTSKATSLSTSIKFAIAGKRDNKKDLGLLCMSYGNIYVASVSMGANYDQTLQALREAEAYEGTSVVIAFSPCIDWGFPDMKQAGQMMKEAVDCGYWSLYRYNPTKSKPLSLDSKKIRGDLFAFLAKQGRFEKLVRMNKELAINLHDLLKQLQSHKQEELLKKSMDDTELLEYLQKKIGQKVNTEKPQLILYGSETGTAASLANSFADEMKNRGMKVKCMAMDDYDIEELPEQTEMVYILASTCGEGALPANMQFFTKALQNPSLDLSNVKYAVFGLGDKSYTHFNESAKVVDTLLSQRGAKRVFETGLGDDKDDEKYETKWYEWYPNLASELKWPLPPEKLPEPKFNLTVTSQTEFKKFKTFLPGGTRLVQMLTNRKLSPQGYNRDVRHYEFDIKDKKMNYGSGDCLSIFAHNKTDQVWGFLDKIGVNPNSTLDISTKDGSKLTDLPSQIPVGQLFQEVLDIFGRPSRRFYEFLRQVASNEQEKKQISHILSKEGKSAMQELIQETTTYADLFLKYPSTVPKLDHLVQYIPPIKPRLYSIASHPSFVGEQIHLCVICDDWTTPSKRYREGLCSNYLKNLNPQNGDQIVSKLYPASITIHEDQTPPIYMIALGTGIAPMRALIQERVSAKKRGEPVGPMTIVFGSRTKNGDFLYEDELMHYKAQGIVQNVITAFSRDQKEKIYVQHRVNENQDIIFDYLYKNRGYFYLCGIKGPEDAVRTSVRSIIQKNAKLSDADADLFMAKLAKEGRFNFETW